MVTVIIKGHEVGVQILTHDPGCQPNRVGHPDNWTEGDPAEIEFEFSTGNKLLDELLTDNYYDEAENQLLKRMRD